jgi:hypothetical protein
MASGHRFAALCLLFPRSRPEIWGDSAVGGPAHHRWVPVLLAVVLIEGVFTIDLAQAAANGHQVTSLTSFNLMTVFTYIYPIVPAPVIFLGLGTILLGSRLLPRVFGFLAFGLGIAFAVVGLIALFTTSILSIVVLSLQALWVLAAALTLLIRAGTAPDTTGVASPGS